MKIYVAGKTDDYERVRQVQEALRRWGHEITYDWTTNVIQVGGPAVPEAGVDENTRREFAEADMKGVRDADLLIALMYPGICGTLIEIGAALALGTQVYIVGKPERNSVFFALPQVTVFENPWDLVWEPTLTS